MSVFIDIILFPILHLTHCLYGDHWTKRWTHRLHHRCQILWGSSEVTAKKSLGREEVKYAAVKKSPTPFIDTK